MVCIMPFGFPVEPEVCARKSENTNSQKSKQQTYVKDEQRILGREKRRRAVVRDLGGLLVPPLIASFNKVDRVTGPLQDKDMLDNRAVLDGIIGEGLDSDGLATATAFVGSYHNARLAVVDTVTERLGGEAGEDNRVDSTNARTCHESGNRLPGHGKVD